MRNVCRTSLEKRVFLQGEYFRLYSLLLTDYTDLLDRVQVDLCVVEQRGGRVTEMHGLLVGVGVHSGLLELGEGQFKLVEVLFRCERGFLNVNDLVVSCILSSLIGVNVS